MVEVITPHRLRTGTEWLAGRDPDLARLVARNGVPPVWRREPGFATLVLIILEQQVSLASARAAFDRLQQALGEVEPEGFLALDDAELLAVGFSRQKAAYSRGLASGLLDGSIDLDALAALDDDEARSRLTGIRGVGPWTADVYLMFALGRIDTWPPGDRALLVSLGRAKGLDDVPTSATGIEMAEAWRPWRSVAARLLWHDYLGGPEAVAP
jgi:DNA-3-methyladenine glycosylase II